MSDSPKKLTLDEIKQKGIKLRRKLDPNELENLILTLYGKRAGYTNILDAVGDADQYPTLKTIVDDMYIQFGPTKNTGFKTTGTNLKTIKGNTTKIWNRVKQAIDVEIKDKKLTFYRPVTKYDNLAALLYNRGTYELDPNNGKREFVDNVAVPGSGTSTSGGNEQSGGRMPNVEINLGKTTDEMLRRIKEPSVEEQMNKMYTELAKDKRFMSLSESQMKKLLKDEYQIDDEGANIMFNSIVAKRAELLNNNRLKREQLTDVDVERLQEQSQRDFERKLHDQNLRYLLPAMLEKRDRLVVNRLNPELLKCGY